MTDNVVTLADRRSQPAPVQTATDMRPRITRIIHRKSRYTSEAYLLGEIGPQAEILSTVDFFAKPEPKNHA